jgi:hypothetical protein
MACEKHGSMYYKECSRCEYDLVQQQRAFQAQKNNHTTASLRGVEIFICQDESQVYGVFLTETEARNFCHLQNTNSPHILLYTCTTIGEPMSGKNRTCFGYMGPLENT